MQNKSAYIWGLLSKIGPQGLYLVTTMILARYLSPDDFGMIGVLSIIFVVANVLLDSGLGGSLIKEKEISAIDCSSITCFNLIVSLIIYITLFLTAEFIENLFAVDGLAEVVKVLGLIFPITGMGIVPKSLMQRNIDFKTIFWNYFASVFLGCVCSLLIAFKGGGVYALVGYQIVTCLSNTILNFIYSKYRLSLRFSLNSLKRLLPFGLFTSCITIIDTIYENLMTSMIGKYMNIQQAGYMYQAKRIEETMSTSLASTIGTVTYPVLTRLNDNAEVFNKEALSTIRAISYLSFPILMLVAVFADDIIVLMFGRDWLPSGFYLETLTFAGIFVIIETLIRNMIKALCEVEKLMVATIVKRSIGITILFVCLYVKAEYIVYGYILSTIIGCIINIVLFKRISSIDVKQLFLCIAKPISIAFLYYLFYKITWIQEASIYTRIAGSILLLSLYYIAYLPSQKINIINILKK